MIRNRRWGLINHWWKVLVKLSLLPVGVKTYFDLNPLLRAHNGVSRFTIHVCGRREVDVHFSENLKDCPNVEIIHYPCDFHNVARYMMKNDLLTPLFAD